MPKQHPPQPDITRKITEIVYELLGHNDGVEFGDGYHNDCKQEADEAVHKLIMLVNEAKKEELNDLIKYTGGEPAALAYTKTRIKELIQ